MCDGVKSGNDSHLPGTAAFNESSPSSLLSSSASFGLSSSILPHLCVWAEGKPLGLWQSVKSRISLCNHRCYLIIYFHYHAFHKTTHGSNLGLELFRVENLFLAFYSLK